MGVKSEMPKDRDSIRDGNVDRGGYWLNRVRSYLIVIAIDDCHRCLVIASGRLKPAVDQNHL